MLSTLTISHLKHEFKEETQRISASVNGELLWFESSDISLIPQAEGFASALLLPALENKWNIAIDGTVDASWLMNVNQLMKIFQKWWGYEPIVFDCKCVTERKASPLKDTALCFSCGIGSFYNLLHPPHSVTHLVFAQGYDMNLDDSTNLNIFKDSLLTICQKTNKIPVIIKTNLKEHSLINKVKWGRCLGGSLVSLGYFMEGIGSFMLSASFPYTVNSPRGTHWLSDPLWSSCDLKVIHAGAEMRRLDKIQSLVQEEMVQDYLRVCEEQHSAKNCSHCEKCLRTMLAIEQFGELDKFNVFVDKDKMIDHLQQIPVIDRDLINVYKSYLGKGLNASYEQAIQSLIKRSLSKKMFAIPFLEKLFKKDE